ncbi:ribosomal protein S18-alanine N-acetyltransferase [Variovorax sp. dw_954]|uniref:ribosomal protein S18-alanine N-acetyltransferase n=1 Tax=Variovorax sp. dw_954 TaxID=2720078 RepID=UPI001BD42929|nr:ribosomal protein S18-alanine N-acetyltransferase [Variovorax sp. dw_954]
MSAVPQPPLQARLEPLVIERLDQVCAVENVAYTHPWTRANFIDSLHAGYHCQLLVGPSPGVDGSVPASAGNRATRRSAADPAGREPIELIGYFVAMKGVDEVHLLNLTVASAFQRQGWAPMLLETLAGWSRGQGAQWLWLEVRASNARAIAVYERGGFRRVGVRKGYYPALQNQREDAIVMSLLLNESASAWGQLK